MSNDDHDATLAISAGDIEKQLKAAQSDSTPAKLVCIDDSQLGDDQKGLEVELMADEVTVGRGEESELRISHKKISRHHARIYLVDGAWWLEDRGSTNGVFLNNEKIEKERLKPGDDVRFGSVPFRFEMDAPDVSVEQLQATSSKPKEEASEDATMMFGAGNIMASEALISASDETEVEEEEETEVSSASRVNESMYESSASYKKSSGGAFKKVVMLMVLGGVLVGGGIFFSKHQEKQAQLAIVEKNNKEIKRFVDDYGVAPGNFDEDTYSKETDIIRAMTANIDLAISKYPELDGIKVLKVKLKFLKFERDIRRFFEMKKATKALELVERMTILIEKTRSKLNDKDSLMMQQISSMVNLAEVVVKYKMFEERYPDPTDIDAPVPEEFDVKKLQRERKKYVLGRKENNKVLTIDFPYFNLLVEHVDKHTIRLVDRWQLLIQQKKQE